jgi:hypothetical protein
MSHYTVMSACSISVTYPSNGSNIVNDSYFCVLIVLVAVRVTLTYIQKLHLPKNTNSEFHSWDTVLL